MKMMFAGAALGVLALGSGAWLAISGDSKQTVASAPVTAINVSASASAHSDFDYDAASLSDRRLWLTKNAGPIAKRFDQTLPKGGEDQPDMRVRGWAVDARRRAIELQVQVKGPFGVDKKSLPAAKKAMIARTCPSYSKSSLGINRVTLVHTFLSDSGREELSVEMNPLVCRAYM